MFTPPAKKARLTPLPHPRADCPSHLFHPSVHDVSHARNLYFCTSCFCLICDVLAAVCDAWSVHCMAYYTHPDWRSLRVKRVTKVPAHLLPPCVVADSKNAPFVDNAQFRNSAASVRIHAPNVCDFIDLENDHVAQLQGSVKEEPEEVPCVEMLDEQQLPGAEQPKQCNKDSKSDPRLGTYKESHKQDADISAKTAEQTKAAKSLQVQRPVRVSPDVEPDVNQVPDNSVAEHHHGKVNVASQRTATPTVKTGNQHLANALPQAQHVGSIKPEQKLNPRHVASCSTQSPDTNLAPASAPVLPNKVELQNVTQRASDEHGNATKQVALTAVLVQQQKHCSLAKKIRLAVKRPAEGYHEKSESEEPSDSEARSDESELEGSDADSQDSESDPEQVLIDVINHCHPTYGLYSTSTSHSTSVQELNNLRCFWRVDKMLPAPHIEKKRLQPAPPTMGKAFPKRILIGYIDMWRPYCSHMAARSIQYSIGRHAKDVASISTGTDVRVTGMNSSQVKVLAKEMGIDLNNTTLLEDDYLVEHMIQVDSHLEGLQTFIGKSSFAWEDGTTMPVEVPEALQECIRNCQIEVKWELSHHTGAENKDKAFATDHDMFRKLDRKSQRELYRQQLAWLTECDARLRNVEKLNRSNCCLLRACVYLSPEVFSSNMVAAANFCHTDSPQAHMQPLDGGPSLGEKLSNNYNWLPWGRERIAPPSLPPKDVENSMRKWDDLELSAHEGNRGAFPVVIAALRCHDEGFVVPAGAKNAGQTYSTVVDATAVDGTAPFRSLCHTYRSSMDSISLSRARELTDELRNVSNEDECDIANKISIRRVLSSPTFTVSDGYNSTADQPPQVSLSLRRYQRESLAWMLDQESKNSVSDPFWVKIRGFSSKGEAVDVFYCPLTGSMSRFGPPPVVGGVLAEEMGLGKTIIAVSLITRTLAEARRTYSKRSGFRTDLVRSHGTLIVCPVSLLKQWEKELRNNVTIPLKVLSWYGPRTSSPKELAKYDVVLTTYGILSAGCSNPLICVHWFRVIIDESTYLKGGGSSCHKQYMDLIASRRWAVSGTPFGDDFRRKFLPTMRFIGVAPFSSSSYFQDLADAFTMRLTDPGLPHSFVVPRLAYVMKNILMRHVKAQKLHGEPLVKLPPATGRCVLIELGAVEKAEYEKLEREVKQNASRFLRNQKAFGAHFVELASMARPLRIKADGVDPESLRKPKAKKEDGKAETAAPVRNATRRVGMKVKRLLNDVRSYRDEDASSKFVVFTEFNGVKEEIKRTIQGNGFGVLSLDGSMTAGRRGRIIKQFAEDPDAAVLVLSMAAGACGLTLTMANVVVLFEVGLKMAMELQAVNRIHRIGQTRAVETLTYVANGTIDERIVDVRKRRGQPSVVGAVAEGGGEDLSTLEVYRTMFGYEGGSS